MATDRTVAFYTGTSPGGYDATYTSWSTLESSENGDLTSPSTRLIIEIVGDWSSSPDTSSSPTWDGWTCNYGNGEYVLIRTVGASKPDYSSGWDSSAYIRTPSGDQCFYLDNDNPSSGDLDMVFEDVQMQSPTGAGQDIVYCKFAASYGTFIFRRCWMRVRYTTGRAYDHDGGADLTRMENCVIESTVASTDVGIFLQGTFGDVQYVNLTMAGFNGTGAKAIDYSDEPTGAALDGHTKNCAVFNNTDDFYRPKSGHTLSYCASDDGDGTNGVDWTNEATDWANVFNGYSTSDFTLKDYSSTGAIKTQGIGPGSDSDIPTTDITGATRSGSTCSIGAYEFVAAGPGISVPLFMQYYKKRRE